MNLLEIAEKAISIDSSEHHGTQEIVDFFEAIAKNRGLHVERITTVHKGLEQGLLYITTHSESPSPQLFLVAHLDTYDPGEYLAWTKTGANPFRLSVDGDNIYGLGAADAKLDFIAKLLALHKSALLPLAANKSVALVGSYGFESSHGLMRLFRQKKIRPQKALVGRPTGLRFAREGLGQAQIEIKIPWTPEEKQFVKTHNLNENSHSQSKVFYRTPHQGDWSDYNDNPIVKALDYMKNLPQGMALISFDGGTSISSAADIAMIELHLADHFDGGAISKLSRLYESLKIFSAHFRKVSSEGFTPNHSTFQLGLCQTTEEGIVLLGECRIVPAAHDEVYRQWLDELKIESEKLGAQFSILDYKSPFSQKISTEWCQLLRASAESVGIPFVMSAAPFVSEASFFQRLGAECLIFGPGQSVVDSHRANESVNLSEVKKAIEFYSQLLVNI